MSGVPPLPVSLCDLGRPRCGGGDRGYDTHGWLCLLVGMIRMTGLPLEHNL